MKTYEVFLTVSTTVVVYVQAEDVETAEGVIDSEAILDSLTSQALEEGVSFDWSVDEIEEVAK